MTSMAPTAHPSQARRTATVPPLAVADAGAAPGGAAPARTVEEGEADVHTRRETAGPVTRGGCME